VLLGLRYVDQRGDDVLTKAAENAGAKIMSVLSPDMQAATSAPLTVPGPDGKSFPPNAVPLSTLRSAIRMQKKLAIDYVDGQQRHTQRVLWPIQLGFMDNARVLIGWCEMRRAFRFFRTDRILSANLGDRYPRRRGDLVRDFEVWIRDEQASGDTVNDNT